MTQSSMREVLDADYLRTATAKGLRRRTVVRRHALPPSATPVVTLVGANMAILVTNVVLVEQIFAVPGVFALTRRATEVGDFPVLQGIVVVAALLVVCGTFLADAVTAWLDPRVRASTG
jgi:peptide/nickel transport system permease protein